MAFPAPFAMSTGLARVHRDELVALQAEIREVIAKVAAELVTGHERRFDDRRPDPAVFIVMQVAPADADRSDVDQDLALASFAQIEGGHANVAGPVNE